MFHRLPYLVPALLVGLLTIPAGSFRDRGARAPEGPGGAALLCPVYSGKVLVDGACACPEGTSDELPPTGRCVPDCPRNRDQTCVRHDALLRAGRRDLPPSDYCDCILRMRADGAAGPRTDSARRPGRLVRLDHCSPFTAQVLEDGRCVCPAGTRLEPFGGYARCLAPCPSGRPHDCSRQIPYLKAWGGDAAPGEFCDCR